ncbi:MAG: transglutaminase domain-containing protein [Lachnospiraceae bacterium]|nr:transglutaminase domain-containing protein [Lachnospiraceae bacterium]
MKKRFTAKLISYGLCFLLLTGCGDATSLSVPSAEQPSQSGTDIMDALQIGSTSAPACSDADSSESTQASADQEASATQPTRTPEPAVTPEPTPEPTPFVPLRDNTPYCPVPEASGTITYGNESATIDASHSDQGYIMANYTGTCPKVKLQIVGPNSYKCTYNLNTSEFQAFPLTAGDGSYTVTVYENVIDSEYVVCYTVDLEVSMPDPFSPYLTPSCYVNYSADTYAVELAAELCETAASDLDCVSLIYNYLIENISYDYDKADQITSGALSTYIADIDGALNSGKGICLDYAALMTCMLRSQRIPTRMEVGYASSAYHAWISTYITDIGWVNGIVEFDGSSWSLMDPTFAASSSEEELREFIGDGSNYSVKYIY